jgi:hypothetical protein
MFHKASSKYRAKRVASNIGDASAWLRKLQRKADNASGFDANAAALRT